MRYKFLFLLLVILICFGWKVKWVKAGECDNPTGLNDITKIEACKKEFQDTSDAISKANTTNVKDLKNLQAQIIKLQGQIKSMEVQLEKLSAEIFDREVKIGVKQELLSAKVRQDYIRRSDQSMLLMLFASHSAADFFKDLSFREKLARQDREVITSVSGEVKSLNDQASQVSQQKTSLAGLKVKVDGQAKWLAGEVEKANKYVADLGGKISALTARQQAILAERTGTFYTSVGDVPLADDPAARPDYNPGFSPAFAVFSFGAPHFKGMSQYGALGRAKAGQLAEDILRAYYGNVEIKKDYDPGKQISVAGYGRMDIETYTKRIYEVPNSWGDSGGMEALKAQAVAARSYALAWTDQGNGGAICTTEGCQVYKNQNKGGKWEEAVNATRGWVMMKNNKPVKAFFSSTSGGFMQAFTDPYSGHSTSGFWDTPSGRGGWTSQAYEKTAGSPWFYKGWYKNRSGDSCGRSHPWLTSEEMADILNAWVVLKQGSDERVAPLGGCWGGSPYSMGDLRSRGGYTSVSGVSVSYSNSGYTANVHFDTNKGGVDINGDEFKEVFNVRGPGRIAIMSGLFNIEKK